jgi:hypothetical protein
MSSIVKYLEFRFSFIRSFVPHLWLEDFIMGARCLSHLLKFICRFRCPIPFQIYRILFLFLVTLYLFCFTVIYSNMVSIFMVFWSSIRLNFLFLSINKNIGDNISCFFLRPETQEYGFIFIYFGPAKMPMRYKCGIIWKLDFGFFRRSWCWLDMTSELLFFPQGMFTPDEALVNKK